METETNKIESNTKMLANDDINKLYENRRTKVYTKPDLKCTCNICPYTSKFLYQMKIHMLSYHQIKDLKSVNKACVKPLSSGLVVKEQASKRVRIANEVQPNDPLEEKKEYYQHYQTPKATPEPSPIKKKVKENPSTKVSNPKVNVPEDNKNMQTISESEKKEYESKEKENISDKKESVTIMCEQIVKDDNNDDIASEVALLIENLQKELKTKDEKVKCVESEKKLLENKLITMRTLLETSKETFERVERDKELLHMEYLKCLTANKEAVKEIEKIKFD